MTVNKKLLNWYKKNGRNLPWRKTQDPYKILVSEVMLQQTQVSRVLLYYKVWLKQFPSWKVLAHASNADVIKAWAGLGYNRRALTLRDIAKKVNEQGIPTSREGWLALKGIGPYTSAALTVFTKREPVMPIDTNIRRVLNRVLLGIPFPDPTLDEKITDKSPDLLSGKNYELVPQALFDLATLICKKSPDCSICPLRDVCKAAPKFLKGQVTVPKTMVKKSNETIFRNKKYPDRIYRGRILKLVRENPKGVSIVAIGSVIDTAFDPKLDQEWINRILLRLEKDQMIVTRRKRIFLP